MSVELLPYDRWKEIEPILEESGSCLPDTDKANILSKCDKSGNIKAFLIIEMLLRAGQLYVAESDSNENIPREFITYLENYIPQGSSVIVIATDERYEGLCQKLQMKEIKGKVFRRDF